jgi:hypothetical protein
MLAKAYALLTSLGFHRRRLLLYVPVGKFCELRMEDFLQVSEMQLSRKRHSKQGVPKSLHYIIQPADTVEGNNLYLLYAVHTNANDRKVLFLGAFAKFREAIISFIMSVRLSVRMNYSVPIGCIFMKFDI